MTDYLIKGESLESIADSTRLFVGSSSKMTPAQIDSALQTGVSELNSEVNTQTSLIEQIKTALVGKAAGSGVTSYGTCTFTYTGLNNSNGIPEMMYMTVDQTGEPSVVVRSGQNVGMVATITCLCNSLIVFSHATSYYHYETVNAQCYSGYSSFVAVLPTAEPGGNASFTVTGAGGGSA